MVLITFIIFIVVVVVAVVVVVVIIIIIIMHGTSGMEVYYTHSCLQHCVRYSVYTRGITRLLIIQQTNKQTNSKPAPRS